MVSISLDTNKKKNTTVKPDIATSTKPSIQVKSTGVVKPSTMTVIKKPEQKPVKPSNNPNKNPNLATGAEPKKHISQTEQQNIIQQTSEIQKESIKPVNTNTSTNIGKTDKKGLAEFLRALISDKMHIVTMLDEEKHWIPKKAVTLDDIYSMAREWNIEI